MEEIFHVRVWLNEGCLQCLAGRIRRERVKEEKIP